METVTIGVKGMMCGGCTGKVERSLGALDGVSEVSADVKSESTTVTYDPSKISLDKLKSMIVEVGYEVA